MSTPPAPRPRRIHELAKDLGTSSKQVLSTAAALGIYLKSASSTISPAQTKLIAMTWQNRTTNTAEALSRPTPIRTNSPYSSTTRRHPVTTPFAHGVVQEDPMEAAIRRNLGIPHTRAPREQPQRRRPPARRPLTALAAEILRRSPHLRESIAQEHADAWITALFAEPQHVIAWLNAGYHHDQLDDVKKLHRVGITTPTLLDAKIGDQTVRQLLRKGEPAHYIARLLQDRSLI